MCGIAGCISSRGKAVHLDLQTLNHRGPDASGEWTSQDGRAWLGNTRLAILDLSAKGNQPMHDSFTGNVIVFNGEIYNHVKLRREMAKQFNDWESNTDTETVLVGYRIFGRDILKKLRGMFALAIYDAKDGSLLLARDPLGIKPLYYKVSGATVSFASEVRTLMEETDKVLSSEAVSAYLQWGVCPEDTLLFPSIKSIPAGHWMRIDSKGIRRLERFWPSYSSMRTHDSEIRRSDPATQVRLLLEKAVEEHLLSDVPVAVFLSSGLDSTALAGLASKINAGQINTFTVSFKERTFDESRLAEAAASYYNTNHNVISIDDDEVVEIIREGVAKMDLPSVDAINTYIVSKKASEIKIKVALSGLGADEIFGGYNIFRDIGKLKVIAALPIPIRQLIRKIGKIGRFVADLPQKRDPCVLAAWRRRFWTSEMLKRVGLPDVPFTLDYCPEKLDDFGKVSWIEIRKYMKDTLLRDSDQMSMAVSLELRVPYLTTELVEYVIALPKEYKYRSGIYKWLLVQAVHDILPHDRKWGKYKKGFSLPMDYWMRGPLESFVQEGLEVIKELKLVKPESIFELSKNFRKGSLHWTRLWSMTVLGHYLKKIGLAEGRR